MDIAAIERTFKYKGRILPDPNPTLSPEQVKQFHAQDNPELTSAAIEGPETKRGTRIYTFVKQTGTKG